MVVTLLKKLLELIKVNKTKTKDYYINYAKEIAKKYSIDAKVFCAIIHAESNWKIDAIYTNTNGSRDIGIVQINSE
jgi:soluble lytic murein transglycosylase-like protein